MAVKMAVKADFRRFQDHAAVLFYRPDKEKHLSGLARFELATP
jgi:hypothetical protein